MADAPAPDEPTEQELADMRGLLRLRLEQVDEMEQLVQDDLAEKRAAKRRCEVELASELQEILLGQDGLRMKRGALGDVVDVTQRDHNRKVRTKALALIDKCVFKRLQPKLLPKQAHAPTTAAGARK